MLTLPKDFQGYHSVYPCGQVHFLKVAISQIPFLGFCILMKSSNIQHVMWHTLSFPDCIVYVFKDILAFNIKEMSKDSQFCRFSYIYVLLSTFACWCTSFFFQVIISISFIKYFDLLLCILLGPVMFQLSFSIV